MDSSFPRRKIAGLDSDIFIPAALTGSAMNGDKVQVEITYRKPGGRAEGRIVSVDQAGARNHRRPAAIRRPSLLRRAQRRKTSGKDPDPRRRSEHKDKIVEVEITQFPTAAHWPAGKIVSVIGFLDDPNVETQVIIKKFGLPTSVSKRSRGRSGASFPMRLDEADLEDRDDFRNRNTITIDPTTARDFDDAIDVEVLPDGSFQLGVHIADVSHFVRPDSAMDHRSAHPRNFRLFSGSRHSDAAGKGFKPSVLAESRVPTGSR